MIKKKITLVGGSGFIGHNLALSLKKSGHDVDIIDSLSINNLYSEEINKSENSFLYNSILKNRLEILNQYKIKLTIQDVREKESLSKIINNSKPDIIIHLAAVSHANKSNKDPHTTFDNSFRTLENTLDVVKKNNVHVIYLSSSMVYGNFLSGKVNEETDCKPLGIYGSLKLSGELLVKAYNQVFNLPYTIIRPSALYGERCISRRVGQIFIENSLTTKKIFISGTGEEKLDFTYIDDFVNGVKLCCENDQAKNQTFNITFGEAKSISTLANIVKKEFPDVDIYYEKKDKLMPERGTLDISKAKNLLNYRPNYELNTGFRKYISWYKEFWKKISEKKK